MNTFTKLQSGEWGIRVEGTAESGDVVTVTKRDGTQEKKVVGHVVWSGKGISLCTIASKYDGSRRQAAYRPQATRARRTGCACGSVEGESRPDDCFSCRHDND